MKALAVTILVVGTVVAALLYFGGFLNYDPAAQAAEFRQTVKSGMTWQEVADLRKPKTMVVYATDSQGFAVERELNMDLDKFAEKAEAGDFAQGFAFHYVFTADDAIAVSFGPDGKVTGVEKLRTVNDLLQGNLIYQ